MGEKIRRGQKKKRRKEKAQGIIDIEQVMKKENKGDLKAAEEK